MSDIAVVGGGPAGAMCAYFAAQNPENNVFVFDKEIILNTILPTGGGRCNLAFAEFDFKELVKYYPRGEKFLLSVFSRFSTVDTIEFFENLGLKTYFQEDYRIFPISDYSKDVKNVLVKCLDKKNVTKMFEKVQNIEKTDNGFKISTDKNIRNFDKVVIATGGRNNGQKLAQNLGHNIVELKPALSSLILKEIEFSKISGMSFKGISAEIYFENKLQKYWTGDLLFTHKGISGPLAYKTASYCAYSGFSEKNPLKIKINFIGKDFNDFDKEFLTVLKTYAQKEVLSILAEFVPKNFALVLLEKLKINPHYKSGQLSKRDRENIVKALTSLEINAIAVTNGEEIVTAGGVDLDEVDAKTMQSKLLSEA